MRSIFIIASMFVFNSIVFCQSTIKTYFPEDDDYLPPHEIGNICSLGCGIDWDTFVQNVDTFSVFNDDLVSTEWISPGFVKPSEVNFGFSFPKSKFESANVKDSILFNGFNFVSYDYSSDSAGLSNYSRLKEVKIFLNHKLIANVVFRLNGYLQEVYIDNYYLKPNDFVLIRPISIYEGKNKNSFGLSEITPLGAH